MPRNHDEILFWKADWSSVIRHQLDNARQAVDALSSTELASDDVEAKIYTRYSLEIPELDGENLSVSHREIEVDVSHDRNRYFSDQGPHYLKGTAIDVRVPFKGDADLFMVRPSTYDLNPPRGTIQGNFVCFTIEGVNLDRSQVKQRIDENVRSIETFLSHQRNSIGDFPDRLKSTIRNAIEARSEKLRADSSLIEGLGYKVEKR
jgi:hypothetical protein